METTSITINLTELIGLFSVLVILSIAVFSGQIRLLLQIFRKVDVMGVKVDNLIKSQKETDNHFKVLYEHRKDCYAGAIHECNSTFVSQKTCELIRNNKG